MPVRIYEIAKDLNLESKAVIAKAKELGITAAKVPSSSLDKITAEYLREQLLPFAASAAPAPAPEPEVPVMIVRPVLPVVEVPAEPEQEQEQEQESVRVPEIVAAVELASEVAPSVVAEASRPPSSHETYPTQ